MLSPLRLFVLMLWLCMLPAQAATYAYRNDVFSYDTPSASAQTVSWHASGASPGCTTYPQGDDDFADITFASATSPTNTFTFTFNGVARSGVRVYSNGMLVFGTDTSGYWRNFNNATLPITTNATAFAGCTSSVPAQMIIPYWTDIVAGTANSTTGASVKYELLGIAPNRRLAISWNNVKLYNTTTRYNFQVLLYESPAGGLNSNFKFQYTTGSSTGSAATVGVQVSTTDYTLYSFNQAFIDPIAGSAILWYPANQLASKQADYRFDEGSWNGTAGEVEDTSGSNQDATRVGAASNVAGGKVCRGGSFTANTSAATQDAVATPISPASVGSIDFWYNSTLRWNSSGNATLFDATVVAARPFFLMKSSAGVLRFSITDSAGTVLTASSAAQSFNAGTWQHVGVSWNLQPGTNRTVLQIFLNGALITTSRTTSSGSIAALSTIDIGDNATSGITPTGGTPNGANGFIDELNIYPTEINAAQATADLNTTRTTCLAFNHFHLVHSGSVINCGNAVANVTIEAHDVNHALFTLSGTTVNLSTSTGHGTWSTVSGGSINPVSDSGSANGVGSYTFSAESAVTVGLSNTFAESTNINVVSGAFTEKSGSAASCVAADYTSGSSCDSDLVFESSGFRFVDASGAILGHQRAGVASSTYYLQAVKSSCTTPGACTGVCTALFPAATPVSVDLAFECNNPQNCQAGQALTFSPGAGAGTAGSIAGNSNGTITASSGTYTAKTLTFNATSPSAALPFTFTYSDAGQITLRARYPSGGGAGTISGQSNAVVVAPARFAFSSVSAAPIKAGAPFSATITALNGATPPAATPNFGKESTAATIGLTHTRCQPTGTGSSSGNLAATPGPFNAGATTINNLTWSEVGNIDLTATLSGGSYLGSGLTVTGNSGLNSIVCNPAGGGVGQVGRFIPHHFETVVTAACSAGAFTYSGQPLQVTVTAKNGLTPAATTINYDGSLNTTPNQANLVTLSDGNAGSGGTLTSNTISAANFTAGIGSAAPVYTFTSKATAPTSLALRASDSDGVSSLGYTEGTALIRSGRIKLSSAYGSEKLALRLPFSLQYFDGTRWTPHAADTCSTITASHFAFAFGGTGNNLAACETALNVSGTKPNYVLQLSAPGAGNNGWSDLTLNLGSTATSTCTTVSGAAGSGSGASLPWLQYFWGAPSAGSNPRARATFGVSKTSPILYQREMY